MAERFLIFGHRGSPNQQPENTVASFEAALRGGADGFETDLLGSESMRNEDGLFVPLQHPGVSDLHHLEPSLVAELLEEPVGELRGEPVLHGIADELPAGALVEVHPVR